MTPYYQRDGVTLYCGDNRDVLPALDVAVSAVVTDPPAGIAFMSKEWDRDKGGRDQWVAWLAGVLADCERLMLPGAHALVWALPRTSGWTHRAIEDAGLDVRDSIVHLFGSGFPKSHNLSGEWDGWGTALKPAAEYWYLARKPFPGTVAQNVLTHGTGALNIAATRITAGASCDSDRSADPAPVSLQSAQDAARRIASVLLACSSDGTTPSRVAGDQDDTWPSVAQCAEILGRLYPNESWCGLSLSGFPDSPAGCPACRHYGDALLRQVQEAAQAGPRPLAYVLDGIAQKLPERIHSLDCRCSGHPSTCDAVRLIWSWLDLLGPNYTAVTIQRPLGRWPPNVCMDEDAAAALDAMSGERSSGPLVGQRSGKDAGRLGAFSGQDTAQKGYPDTGGASRFMAVLPVDDPDTLRLLYCSKSSRRERNAGLEGMPEVNPFERGGPSHNFERMGSLSTPRQNHHPTVKPLALMRWLLTLVTPPGGIILDPFAGSGSTLVAAASLGIPAIGVELDPEYCAIAARRIDHALNERAKQARSLPLELVAD